MSDAPIYQWYEDPNMPEKCPKCRSRTFILKMKHLVCSNCKIIVVANYTLLRENEDTVQDLL